MENLNKQPKKGILKNSSSFEAPEAKPTDIKWDEMNILQTLHPPDKDYGFMKIDEPKTPYSYDAPPAEGDSEGSTTVPVQRPLDPDTVAQKISVAKERRLSIDDAACSPGHDADEDDEDDLTEEEKQKRKEFEMKRKSHYNEFQAVKLARQLLEEEEDDDEEGEKNQGEGEEENEDGEEDGEAEQQSSNKPRGDQEKQQPSQ